MEGTFGFFQADGTPYITSCGELRLADCFDVEEWDDHEMPMGFLGMSSPEVPTVRLYWGEFYYGLGVQTIRNWEPSVIGSGIGKLDYELIQGVDVFSDKKIVVLEGAPEYSIEIWDISEDVRFTGVSISGFGDDFDKFSFPIDVTIDTEDNVYVLDFLSTQQSQVKMFDSNLQPLGVMGDGSTITGMPIALDWDDYGNTVHVLHSEGVAVFIK